VSKYLLCDNVEEPSFTIGAHDMFLIGARKLLNVLSAYYSQNLRQKEKAWITGNLRQKPARVHKKLWFEWFSEAP
jgi:hypothetical protein